MAKKDFEIEFTFVSTKADGDDYTWCVTVRADNAVSAVNSAWSRRVEFFGARGNDNAVDCRVKVTQ